MMEQAILELAQRHERLAVRVEFKEKDIRQLQKLVSDGNGVVALVVEVPLIKRRIEILEDKYGELDKEFSEHKKATNKWTQIAKIIGTVGAIVTAIAGVLLVLYK